MERHLKVWLLGVLSIAVVIGAASVLASMQTHTSIESNGIVNTTGYTLAFYSDPECTLPITAVSLGVMDVNGSFPEFVFYVRNEGSVSVDSLQFWAANFSPAHMTQHLFINFFGVWSGPLQPNEIIAQKVIVRLDCAYEPFHFDILVA